MNFVEWDGKTSPRSDAAGTFCYRPLSVSQQPAHPPAEVQERQQHRDAAVSDRPVFHGGSIKTLSLIR